MLDAPNDELKQRAQQAEREGAAAARRAAAAGGEHAGSTAALQQRVAEIPQRLEAYAQLRKLDAADLDVKVRAAPCTTCGTDACTA